MASPKNRPSGIVIIAVLWTLVSIYNIYQGLNIIIVDLGLLPHTSDPNVNEWFTFGVPAEVVLGFFVVAYAFMTLLVVYGLYTARSWSYHFALALPVFILVINIATTGLYASAPPELELRGAVEGAIPYILLNLIWLVGVWSYLPRPHVKQYLNQIPTLAPMSVAVPPPPVDVATSEEKKFCRYCGAEQKSDAVFCEKCGRVLVKRE